MTSTVFQDFVTPVPAAWLNDVNTSTYTTVPAEIARATAAESLRPTSATLAAAGGAALIGNTPAGNIAATNVQAALNELDTEKAILGVIAGTAVQVDQATTAWTRAATTTLGTTLNGTLSDTSATITAFNGVAGVTYHVRVLGAGSITHHATNLIITQGLASITTAVGDTFDVEMLTATTCRIKNYIPASKVLTPYSSILVNTSNGYGSTNTKYRRFVNVVNSTGTDITYADSATNGGSFTVNTAGIYSISYTDNFNTSSNMGITLNDNQGTTNIVSTTISNILSFAGTSATTITSCAVVTIPLAAGAVINAKTDGAATGAAAYTFFSITRVA